MPAWCVPTRPPSIASTSASRTARSAGSRPNSRPSNAPQVFDGKNYLAFPGCVDAHMHIGIYSPLAEDAVSESKAAAMGGVTSSLNYIRTGHYYLNRGGPYREFMPEVFKQSDGRFWVDYGYHVAPIEAAHIDEMEHLVLEHGDHIVQDIHVLRRLWPARTLVAAKRISDDRAGRALRHRAFRIHHAIGAASDGQISRTRRPISA